MDQIQSETPLGHYVQAQGPPLPAKVSFVRVGLAHWTQSGYNRTVSTSVFSVEKWHHVCL